jgi:hypothetical protein
MDLQSLSAWKRTGSEVNSKSGNATPVGWFRSLSPDPEGSVRTQIENPLGIDIGRFWG